MADFKPIYLDRELFVPTFEIYVRGQGLPGDVLRDVVSVTYKDGIDQIDSFDLQVNNWDAATFDFKYTGAARLNARGEQVRRIFEPGQTIELWMGYRSPAPGEPSTTRLMLAGIITSLSPSFPAAGQPTVRVSGQNVLRKLLTKQETHSYTKNTTPSQIARQIVNRGNLKIDNLTVGIETTGSNEAALGHVLQDNQYDILFLLQLAHQNGYDVLLRDKADGKGRARPVLLFGPSTNDRGTWKLEWGKSLMHFAPTLTTAKQVFDLTVRGWDALNKKKIEVTVTRDQLLSRPLKDTEQRKRIEQGFREHREIIVDRPFRTPGEAKRYALDKLQRLANDMVTGTGATVGTPGLRTGSIICMAGLGPTFDGRYFVKSTTHTIGTGGYTTEFEVRMEEPQKESQGQG